jgi:hypothetical protein
MSIFRRLCFLLPMAIPLFAIANPTVQQSKTATPLIDQVRAGTERYQELSVALAEGFVQATPCVSGPDTGAMGVHFVLPSRVNAALLQGDQPQALIYEPMTNGAMRLVGVEFIILAELWDGKNPPGTIAAPSLDGDLFNYVPAPNRYGLPAFYELHVWAWEHNPKGSFADWNTAVNCDKQPGT